MDLDTATELQRELHSRGVGSLVALDSEEDATYRVRHLSSSVISHQTLELLLSLARTFDCDLSVVLKPDVLHAEFRGL